MQWRMQPCGLERRTSNLQGLKCAWCGRPRRTMFVYRAGRLRRILGLSGLSGEGRPFCNLECFRSFQ